MPVLSLSQNVRHEHRLDVAIDGLRIATVGMDAVERLGLRDGAQVDAGIAEQLEGEEAALRTYDRAVNMLAARSRASRELRNALLRKGEPSAFVDRAIDRLVALGHLDDARFARQFTRSRVVGGGMARRRVRGELARRGIASADADEAIAEVLEDEAIDERELLLAAARRRLHVLGRLEPAVRRRRLHAWLARRGYDADDIARALDVLFRGDEGAEP